MLAVAPVFGDLVPQAAIAYDAGSNASFGGEVTAAAIQDVGSLDRAFVFGLSVTTTSDILIVEAGISNTPGENAVGGWYNDHDLGASNSDINPPTSAQLTQFPYLRADTWMTTPGSGTFVVGSNRLDGDAGSNVALHADTSGDGAQSGFRFAQVTLLPDANNRARATFAGSLQSSATGSPLVDTINYTLAVGDFRVTRGAASGASVGTMTATDGDGDTMTFSISAGNAGGEFQIDATTGEITTAKTLSALSYELTIQVEDTENRTATKSVMINVSDAAHSGWHNTLDRQDVNNSGQTTPLDALLIINEMLARDFSDSTTGVIDGSLAVPHYFDVDGDQKIAPIDALLVINRLNLQANPAAALSVQVEGESDSEDEPNSAGGHVRDLVFAELG